MKKFLILLLAIFTCFNTEAIPIAHSTLPAKVAAANAARRQRERKRQHEEEFHHGKEVYDVVLVEKIFAFKDSEPTTIETYEIRKWYYEIDPDKCTIREEKVLKSSKPVTEQEIEIINFTLISFFVLVTISLVVLIGFVIYQERKKKLSIGYKEI
jgi:hypothetical protein